MIDQCVAFRFFEVPNSVVQPSKYKMQNYNLSLNLIDKYNIRKQPITNNNKNKMT